MQKKVGMYLIMFWVLCFTLACGITYAQTIKTTVVDTNHDSAVSVGDKVEKLYQNGWLDLEVFSEQDYKNVILNKFDVNGDKKIQKDEYQKYLDFCSQDTFIVTLEPTPIQSIVAKITDSNRDGYVTAGEKYTFLLSKGGKEYGHFEQSTLDAVKEKGFDKDGLVTTKELLSYLNSLKQFTWSIELINPPVASNYDVYSIVTDENKDGNISLGEPYSHRAFTSNGEVSWKEAGTIIQAHLDMVLNGGFDTNGDGKVQKEEFESAARAYTNKSHLLTLAPAIVDMTKYWPTKLGNVWEYTNKAYSDRKNWITIIKGISEGSNLDAFFTKNHKDTYWGNGAEMSYRMGLNWVNQMTDSLDLPHLAASSTRSYTDAFDFTPDASVYWSNNHQFAKFKYADYWNVKNQSCKGNVPYFIFPNQLDINNFKVDSIQGQYHFNYEWPSGVRTATKEDNHTWKITYEWEYLKTEVGYEGIAVHLKCDEAYAQPGVFEDWYFGENLGMLRIEQYTDTTRTDRLIQINASKIFLN